MGNSEAVVPKVKAYSPTVLPLNGADFQRLVSFTTLERVSQTKWLRYHCYRAREREKRSKGKLQLLAEHGERESGEEGLQGDKMRKTADSYHSYTLLEFNVFFERLCMYGIKKSTSRISLKRLVSKTGLFTMVLSLVNAPRKLGLAGWVSSIVPQRADCPSDVVRGQSDSAEVPFYFRIGRKRYKTEHQQRTKDRKSSSPSSRQLGNHREEPKDTEETQECSDEGQHDGQVVVICLIAVLLLHHSNGEGGKPQESQERGQRPSSLSITCLGIATSSSK
ncbi:hypothetical protein SELMODRAFT_425349 [Selaginella moellendorffii]|uniref:Uncharacterized protein n=1 Tax=Selaginella moellendorffii TaxID=88036 RepID=D8SST7_SELML|nr:hypothetical protein SELMODRAFT_425349 [Selaginella moellendorffii]